jgi:rubrerythrin
MMETFDPLAAAHGVTAGAPREPGISAVERLLNQFESHERQEMAFIDGYKSIVDGHKNPLVRFLLALIISDEEKHHAVVRAMATSLRADLTWSDAEGAIGNLGEIAAEERKDLLRLTAEFIAEEKRGIKEYKALAKSSKGYYEGSFTLLLKTIVHDSEKHLMILEFLEKKLKQA